MRLVAGLYLMLDCTHKSKLTDGPERTIAHKVVVSKPALDHPNDRIAML